MKTKYTSKLLIGAATLSLATFISQGNADASEKTSSLADAQPATFESANVSADQKAFYQVLHMDGISESQRDQYIKQLHEDPSSAQNVFSESIKDATNPERRVAQQNAFYSLLHNKDLSDTQREQYIKEIKENPDQSQDVFVKSLNSTPEAPKNDILEKEEQSILDANSALQALQQEDTIQNRRTAQRAVNKLPKHKVDAFQKELDAINGPRDEKIKADAAAKQQGLQIGESPNVEKTPVPIEDKPEAETEKKPEAKDTKKAEKTPKVEDKKAPKTEEKSQTEKSSETKKVDEAKPSTEAKDSTDNSAVAPVLPKVNETTKTAPTLSSYWHDFKNSVTKGYTYVKDSVTNSYEYLKKQYNYVTEKYNKAKYFAELYKNHKKLIDKTVLGFLSKDSTKAYIEPLDTKSSTNPFSKSYAHTRNFVTESINTGKVLYTLYQHPAVIDTAITAVKTYETAKNAISSIFSFFK